MIKSPQTVPDYTNLSSEELVQACAELRNVEAWEEFVRRFNPLIIKIARRVAARFATDPNDVCDDIASEVYMKLAAHEAKALLGFHPRHEGSAYGYLAVVAKNTARDYFSRRQLPVIDAFPLEKVPAQEVIEWRIRLRDVEDILQRKVNDDERQMFWLYYRQGLTAKAIAELPGQKLTQKGVEAALRRVGSIVRRELAAQRRGQKKGKGKAEAVSEGKDE